MGNKQSDDNSNSHTSNHPHHDHEHSGSSQQHQIRPEVIRAFNELSGGESLINQENFKVWKLENIWINNKKNQEKLGDSLGESFWTWICKDDNGISLKKFNKAAIAFSVISSSSLVQILLPAGNLVCLI